MNVAIILAGGVGSRVGRNIPKQFIEIDNKPIIAYTIEKFQDSSVIDEIEVVCIDSYRDELLNIINKYNYSKVKYIAPGGKDFQESVYNGIKYLEGKISNDSNVIIHFGASPFVTEDIIEDCIKVCNEKGNAISTTPFFLLSGLKEKDGDKCTEWIDRDTIACMNSPHAFKYDLVLNMYEKAIQNNLINEVEPHTTTLMCRMGIPIYFSKGSQTNIKITTEEDLELFEAYVMYKKTI